MATVFNSFESPASGTQLTNGNGSNADGSTAWSGATIGTGGTLVTSTTHAHAGTQSLKVATAGTAAATFALWSAVGPFNTNATTIWGRLYCYFTANPSAGFKLIQTMGATNGIAGQLAVNASGKLVGADTAGTNQTTSSNSIPLNQWFRVEFKHVASTSSGIVEVKLFASPEAVTPTETNTATGLNTNPGSGGFITGVRIGQCATNANLGPAWVDDVAFSDTGYLGPRAVAVSLSGVVKDVAIASPAGGLALALSLAGSVVNVALAAPPGVIGGLTGITGPTAAVTLAAPTGNYAAGRNLVGPVVDVAVAAPAGLLGRRLNVGPVVDVAIMSPGGRVIIIPPHIFRPPTIKLRPPDPQGERLWIYFGLDYGISVLKNQDGTYFQTQYPSTDEINEAAITYLGGHEYQVTDDEYESLVAAGYFPFFDNPLDDGGYGDGVYGGNAYGE